MKCEICKKHIICLYNCKNCEKTLCMRCRMPEDHACSGQKDKKASEIAHLKEDLMKHATKDTHHFNRLDSS